MSKEKKQDWYYVIGWFLLGFILVKIFGFIDGLLLAVTITLLKYEIIKESKKEQEE